MKSKTMLRLNKLSNLLAAISFVPPLAVSMVITSALHIHNNRLQDRLMMVCGFFWLPIILPCFAVALTIDAITGEKKF